MWLRAVEMAKRDPDFDFNENEIIEIMKDCGPPLPEASTKTNKKKGESCGSSG
jgi:hypothetical protein